MSEEMNNEYEYVDVETIDVVLEDDSVVTCAIVDDFEVDDKKYYALAPIDENDVISEDEVWFYNYEEDGEDIILNYIDDEEELKVCIAAYEDYLEGDDDEEEEE